MIIPAHILRREKPLAPFTERTAHNGLTFGLSTAGYDIRIKQGLLMWPLRFALASSIERFQMPADMLGIVCDKSTWARRGIAVQNTVIEPGWCGWLTLEITNHAWRCNRIRAGDAIAQIIFHRLEEPAEPYKGKYQNQENRPVPAKRYEDWVWP